MMPQGSTFTTRPQLAGTFGMVASTHWLASAAGMAVLEKGGNALDAVARAQARQVLRPPLPSQPRNASRGRWPSNTRSSSPDPRDSPARAQAPGAGNAGGGPSNRPWTGSVHQRGQGAAARHTSPPMASTHSRGCGPLARATRAAGRDGAERVFCLHDILSISRGPRPPKPLILAILVIQMTRLTRFF